MAIRFTPEYNRNLYKIVKNYNQKVKRANEEGKIPRALLPQEVSIRQLKRNYTSREELDRELENLKLFKRKSIRHSAGEPITGYEMQVLRTTQQKAKEFYEHQYKVFKPVARPYDPEDISKLEMFKTNIELLNKDIDKVAEDDLKAMERAVHNYRHSFNKQGAGYRAFLEEIEWVMNTVGVPKAEKEAFFKKIKKLTPQQFYDIYVSQDLVQRAYELADSPAYGKMKLNTTEENAREDIIQPLLDSIDIFIQEQQK